MKKIFFIVVITIVISGCVGGEDKTQENKIELDDYQEVKNSTSTSIGAEDNLGLSLEILEVKDRSIKVKTGGVFPSSNYKMTINNISVKNKTINIRGESYKEKQLGATVLTSHRKVLSINGKNIKDTKLVTFGINGNVVGDKNVVEEKIPE